MSEPKYLTEFIEAVYPEFPELARATASDEEFIKDATARIKELEAEAERRRKAYDELHEVVRPLRRDNAHVPGGGAHELSGILEGIHPRSPIDGGDNDDAASLQPPVLDPPKPVPRVSRPGRLVVGGHIGGLHDIHVDDIGISTTPDLPPHHGALDGHRILREGGAVPDAPSVALLVEGRSLLSRPGRLHLRLNEGGSSDGRLNGGLSHGCVHAAKYARSRPGCRLRGSLMP